MINPRLLPAVETAYHPLWDRGWSADELLSLWDGRVNIYIAKAIAQNGNETIGNDTITEAQPPGKRGADSCFCRIVRSHGDHRAG